MKKQMFILIALFLHCNTVSAEMILSFSEEEIPVFDNKGAFDRVVKATSFGQPSEMVYQGRGENNLMIFLYGNNKQLVFLDEMYLQLDPNASDQKVTVLCLEKSIKSKDFDYRRASTTGIGECN